MNDLISIIIPIYNVEDYLDNCINSVHNQSYKNIEILLINDGSTDNSKSICDKWVKKDNRIKLYNKTNGGLSDARNYGISKANGKYLFFLDSDDYIDLSIIDILYSNLKKYNANISIANRIDFYSNGKKKIKFSKEKIEVFSNVAAIEEINLYNYFDMSSCGKLFEKRLFKNIEFPVGKLCEDYYIMYRIFDNCKKIIYIPDVYYYYFQRMGSISKNKKINWDFVHAAIEQCNVVSKKYPSLEKAMKTAIAFSYLTIFDTIILNKGNISKDDYEKIRIGVKENLSYAIYNKKISVIKKIQLLVFVYIPQVYNCFYKLYKKIWR